MRQHSLQCHMGVLDVLNYALLILTSSRLGGSAIAFVDTMISFLILLILYHLIVRL